MVESDGVKVYESNEINGVDIIIEVEEGRDLKIMQLADLQIWTYHDARTEEKKQDIYNRFGQYYPEDLGPRVWDFVEEGYENIEPDIVVMTGDNIYGETDDNGEDFLAVCNTLDSYKKPWFCVWGNHDNESGMGVRWQIETVQNSKYGFIIQGDVTGNSNYSAMVKQGDEYLQLLYFIDTNGCVIGAEGSGTSMAPDNIDIDLVAPMGIYDDQIEWMRTSANAAFEAIGERVPVLVFQHIPPVEAQIALEEKYPKTYTTYPFYANLEGDKGISKENNTWAGLVNTDGKYWSALKEIGCVGVSMGHYHKSATSVVYDGIRLTYGLKTGVESYCDPYTLGTTQITIFEDRSFDVKYWLSFLEDPRL